VGKAHYIQTLLSWRVQGTGEGVQVSQTSYIERTTEMETARKYIEIVHDRGKRDLPLKKMYGHLLNRDLFLVAYGKLYANKGATKWAVFMMERHRKVVFVCHRCHTKIHAGRYDGRKVE